MTWELGPRKRLFAVKLLLSIALEALKTVSSDLFSLLLDEAYRTAGKL